jgi:hypothetical protein
VCVRGRDTIWAEKDPKEDMIWAEKDPKEDRVGFLCDGLLILFFSKKIKICSFKKLIIVSEFRVPSLRPDV